MIKPETIEGVPEEEGYYFLKRSKYSQWKMVKVRENLNFKLTAYGTGNAKDQIKQDKFKYCDWSERIEEPDVNNP